MDRQWRIFGCLSIACFLASATLLFFPAVAGCESFTRDDGSKTMVMSSATTRAVGETKATADAVTVVAPKGSGVNEIAGLIGTIAGAILAVDQMRRKSTHKTAANVAQCKADQLASELASVKAMIGTASLHAAQSDAAASIVTRSQK